MKSGPFRLNASGFSYIEVLIASTLMAVALAPIVQSLSTPWVSSSEEDYLILNTSRDKMEQILSMDFASIPVDDLAGENTLTDIVTINGKSITRDVTVVTYDLDGDLAPESDAKKITLDVEDILINALKVDP